MMNKNNDFYNLIKDSMHEADLLNEVAVSITSLEDMMKKIKKDKRKKFVKCVLKPMMMMIVVVLLLVAFLTIVFSDIPMANALKFNFEKVNWHNHLDKDDNVTLLYDDFANNKSTISLHYIYGNIDEVIKKDKG